MSSLTPSSNNGNSFVISDYLELLQPSEKEKGKYQCPVCLGHNLSIAKDGKRYKCFDGCTGNQIAYALRGKNGEFSPKKSTNSIDPLQVYNPDETKADEQSKTDGKKPKSDDKKKNDETIFLSSNVFALRFITRIWGDKLRFNLRTLEIELDSKKLDSDTIHTTLAEKYNADITKERAVSVCYHLAKKTEFDPVKAYFDSLSEKASFITKEGIANLLFYVEDSYYDDLTWLFLLGVVKRCYEPGCKFDYAFVLQGDQGLGKSSFFRALLPDSFSDAMSSKLGTDDLRIMHGHAINEWGELGNFTAKQYEDVIKAFLSRQEDKFRLPYAKDLLTMPRRSVICGSVNEAQFLTDLTGNRRFVVLPTQKIISPLDLATMRDDLWAAVIADYLENWRGPLNELSLSDNSRARQKEENDRFKHSDILEDAIAQYVDGREGIWLNMTEIMGHLADWQNGLLGLKAGDRGTQMRVAKILNGLGWTKKLKRVGGKPQKVWIHQSQN